MCSDNKKMSAQTKPKIIQPDELVTLSKKVVARYVANNAIPQRDKDDVAMTIVSNFLAAEEKINNSFKGQSKTSTYCIAILNRMCCEIIRKDFKQWKQVQQNENFLTDNKSTNAFESSKSAIIKSELQRLNYILEFFNEEQFKVIVFLKYILDIPFTRSEVNNYAKSDSSVVFEQLEQNKDEALATRYQILADIVNKTEGRSVKGDAIRMWLNKSIDTIIRRMNASGASNYNREALGILLEMR